jgi:lysine-specific permease
MSQEHEEASGTSDTEVKRVLQTRHLSMIALGGSIGTGLFLACGEAVSGSGPGGAMLSYIIIGILIYFLMSGLGEIATFLPTSGSFSTYSEKFVDPALGFASGWNDFFKNCIVLTVDAISSGILIRYWLPNTPKWIWHISAFILVFLVNAFTARSFGEIEFWLALLKIITIILFIILGVLRIFGAIGTPTYFNNFIIGDAPFVGGIEGILTSLVIAGFSFQGTELVGITAAESDDPQKSIPNAVRQVFWRIIIFYICSMFVISCLIAYNDPSLLGAAVSDVTKSPFTIVLRQVSVYAAADIMNAIILSSILSSMNSMLYSSSRMLYSLSLNKKAPLIFSRTMNSGVPLFALFGTSSISVVLYFLTFLPWDIYSNLISASSLAGFINWFTIAISHYRFRRAFQRENLSLEYLHYHAPLFPVGPIVVMISCVVILILSNLKWFRVGKWGEIAISYMSVILFVVLLLGYKFIMKSKIVDYERMLKEPEDAEPSYSDMKKGLLYG